jgi:hypothetical protein
MRLPRDLLDEIELEFRLVNRNRRRHNERLLALEELRAVALVQARQLDQPLTAADLIGGAADPVDRERRRALMRVLRARRP